MKALFFCGLFFLVAAPLLGQAPITIISTVLVKPADPLAGVSAEEWAGKGLYVLSTPGLKPARLKGKPAQRLYVDSDLNLFERSDFKSADGRRIKALQRLALRLPDGLTGSYGPFSKNTEREGVDYFEERFDQLDFTSQVAASVFLLPRISARHSRFLVACNTLKAAAVKETPENQKALNEALKPCSPPSPQKAKPK